MIQKGRLDEGLQTLRRAAVKDTGQVASFERVARALIPGGRFAEAVSVLDAGLGLAENNIGMLRLLSKLLATCPDVGLRDGRRALGLAERACKLTNWTDPDSLDAEAAAHFALGDTEQAIATAQKAVELARRQGNGAQVAGIQRRLQGYEAMRGVSGSDPESPPETP